MDYQMVKTMNTKDISKYITPKKIVNPLREGWVSLLNRYNWDWFVTLTFADFPKSYTAINRFNRWLIYLQRKERRRIGFYCAMEFTMQGVPHFHALMGNLARVRRLTWKDNWKYGYARIYPYDPKLGANYYLTKYCVKTEYQAGWYDIKGLRYLNQLPLDL